MNCLKKITNILITLLLIFNLFIISSCDNIDIDEQPSTVILPDLTNKSRSEISTILESLKIDYIFKFDYSIINNDDELDKFVSFNNGYIAGDEYNTKDQLYVYTTVLPLTYSNVEQVKMDFDYQGKSFINDGVGKCTLVSPTDGDTARFRDVITGEVIRVRFLGIDTPESTIDHDPWGDAASLYTKTRLYNAKEIVLEAEGARTEGYGRYLAFVWVDNVLLNLEIIQQAYSNGLLNSKSKYYSYFFKASNEALKTGRRFFGEIDPDYNYK